MPTNFKKFYGYLDLNSKKRIIFTFPFILLASVMELLSIALIIPLIKIFQSDSKLEFFLFENNYTFDISDNLKGYLIMIILFFIFRALILLFLNFLCLRTIALVKSEIQTKLMNNYLSLRYLDFIKIKISSITHTITSECNQLDAKFLTPIYILISESIPLLFILIFLYFLNPLGLLVCFIFGLIVGSIMIFFTSKKLHNLASNQISFDRLVIKTIKDSCSSFKEIFVNQKQDIIVNKIKFFTINSSMNIALSNLINLIPRVIFEILTVIFIVVLFISVSSYNSMLDDPFIEVSIFAVSLIRLGPSFSKIISHIQALNYAKPTINNILEVLDYQVKPKPSLPNNFKNEHFKSLEFKNFFFSYNNKPMINNFNLKVKSGDVIGIIGKSGAGKSTLINLMLGLILPAKGKIFFNENEITNDKYKLLSNIGYTPQDPLITDESIIDNISFYSKINKQKIIKILKLLKFTVPNTIGLDGPASALSGGQKQRISIARAIYRDAKIYIFDEITSALDGDSKKNILGFIKYLKENNKTIIFITHDDLLLEHCTKVIKITNSQIKITNV